MAAHSFVFSEKQTVSDLLVQVRRLIKKYRETLNENEELRVHMQELQREVADLRERMRQLEAERDAIRLQVSELLEELNRLELE